MGAAVTDYKVFNGSTWAPAREAYKHNGTTWAKVWPTGPPKVKILGVRFEEVPQQGYSAVVSWEKLPGRYVYHVGINVEAPVTLGHLRDEESGDHASLFVGRSDWYGKTAEFGIIAEDLESGAKGEMATSSFVIQQPAPGEPLNLRREIILKPDRSYALTASWTAPNSGGPVADYEYEWGPAAYGFGSDSMQMDETVTTNVEAFVKPEESKRDFLFRVRARGLNGHEALNGPWVEAGLIGTAEWPVPLEKPGRVAQPVTVSTPGSKVLKVTWQKPSGGEPETYLIRGGNARAGSPWRPDNGGRDIGNVLSYEFDVTEFQHLDNLAEWGQRWECQIMARNAAGDSPNWSPAGRAEAFEVPQLTAPTNLRVVQQANKREVTLTWSAPAGPRPQRYGVRYGIAGGALEPDVTFTNDDRNSFTFPAKTFEGVRNGERWNFNIQSLNGEGEPGYSGWAGYEGLTFSGIGMPAVPPGPLKLVSVERGGSTTINIRWTPPITGGEPRTNKLVLTNVGTGRSRETELSGDTHHPNGDRQSNVSVSAVGGSPYATWRVQLTPTNDYGDGPTADQQFTVNRSLGSPQNLRAGLVTHDSIEVLWDPVEEATAYAVFSNGRMRSFTPVPDAGTHAQVGSLAPDTEHVFQVVAVADGVIGEESEELPVRTTAAPVEDGKLPAPVVKLERNKPAWNKWQASWTPVEGAASYVLQWKGSTPEGGGHGDHTVTDLTDTQYQYTGSDLAWNEVVSCQVAAVDSSGVQGEWSTPQDAA